MLQLIFAASFLVGHPTSASAEDSYDENESDDDNSASGSNFGGGSIAGFTNRNGTVIGSQKPPDKFGRLLNQDEVTAAIASGNAATLPLLLAYLNLYYPGKVLDVRLHAKEEKYIYEIKLLSNTIFLRTVLLDARTLGKI